ncbi:MAG: D-alanyl-D-alanine carboxypeptidase [Ruminococcaceae bacterium]|nr:D-alanyl-D-alanine carboxypeptidase [Oscillospiraceae bacterium]
MRNLLTIFLAAALLFTAAVPTRALDISASSAIVMEVGGAVVFERDADTRRPMASTTKIMTALTAIESGALSRTVTVPPEAAGVEGSSIYLEPGDRLTLEDLVWALMLESANDAAAAIALELGGSIEGFAALMNEKAAELGLSDTHFTNPHGLSDDSHYTTARELAILSAHAMKNPTFRQIVSSESHVIRIGDTTRQLHNHNKLLRMYDGAVGVKTGFTKASGRCLVSAAERDGVTLVAVTLNAPDDWRDHTAMLDLGFETLEAVTLAEPLSIVHRRPCIGAACEITAQNREGLTVILPRGEHSVTGTVELAPYLWAPVKAGDVLGRIVFRDGETVLGELPLYAVNDAPRIVYKKTLLERIFH